MANSPSEIPSQELRRALVFWYLILGVALYFAALVLAWFAKPGAFGFVAAGTYVESWAFLVATQQTISVPLVALLARASSRPY